MVLAIITLSYVCIVVKFTSRLAQYMYQGGVILIFCDLKKYIFKFLFVPKAPSPSRVFTLCTIFGRMLGFEPELLMQLQPGVLPMSYRSLIFKNGHIAVDWLYFYVFNSKKSANFALHLCGARAAKLSFSKNHRDL